MKRLGYVAVLVIVLALATCTITYHPEVNIHVHKKHIRINKYDSLAKQDTITIKYIKGK